MNISISESKVRDAERNEETESQFPDYCYIDTALGDVRFRNNVKKIDEIILPDPQIECYTSMFRFGKEYKKHCDKTGSVKDIGNMPCYCDHLWFDIDDSDLERARLRAIELLAKIESEYKAKAVIYFSGSKGFHIGISAVCIGAEPRSDLAQIFKIMASTIAGDIPIDTSIYEKNRLWRAPNTINKKSGLYKIPLTYEELAQLDSEVIKKLAGSRRAPTLTASITSKHINVLNQLYNNAISEINQANIDNDSKPVSSSQSKTEPNWIADALSGLQNGNRNTTFTKIAGRLNHDGWQSIDILALLYPHANGCSFPEDELKSLVEGICSRYPSNVSVSNSPYIYNRKTETETTPPQILTFSEFMAIKDTEITWRVENIFPTEGVGIIASPPGYGKSWMLIDLAVEITRGGLWLGQFQTTKGSVLYIDEESSEQLLRHRFKKLINGKKLSEDQLDFHITVNSGICFNDRKSVEHLHRLIDDIHPGVVIIDSLIRVHRAEENSAKEMSQIFAEVKSLFRKGHCLFIFADHQRKMGYIRAGGDQLLRGSSEKVAFVDTLLSIQRVDKKLVVDHTKARFSEPVPSFIISIEDPSEDSTTVAYQGDAEETKKQEKLKNALELIDGAIEAEKWTSRKDLVALSKVAHVSEKTLAEGLKLRESEKVIEREDRKPSTGRGGKSAHYRRVIPEENDKNELSLLTEEAL